MRCKQLYHGKRAGAAAVVQQVFDHRAQTFDSLLKLLRSIQAETDTKRSRIETGSVEDLTGDECNPAPNSSEIELGNIRAFGQRQPETQAAFGLAHRRSRRHAGDQTVVQQTPPPPIFFAQSLQQVSVAAPGKIPSDGFLHETVA